MILKIKPTKNEFIESIYEKSMKELDEFFELNWKRNRPNIYLIPNKETIKAIRGEESPDWLTGWVSGNDVYVLNKFEKENKPSDDECFYLIKHELAHSFTKVFMGFGGKPKWLWEGIAIYLSGELKTRKKPKKLENFLEFYESGAVGGVYKESGFAVEFLVKKFGKKKLLNLLKVLSETDTKEQFADKFKEIYGISLEYKNFNIL